ncbi:MAG: MGMT family protein [Raoultibacter sp.]
MAEFTDKVFEIVRQIPRGKVSTYGQIAGLIGSPRSARYVGYALRRNVDSSIYPCHRVLFRDGGLCEGYIFGGAGEQKKLLEAEGIGFLDENHVDLDAHLWVPSLEYPGRPDNIDWERELAD